MTQTVTSENSSVRYIVAQRDNKYVVTDTLSNRQSASYVSAERAQRDCDKRNAKHAASIAASAQNESETVTVQNETQNESETVTVTETVTVQNETKTDDAQNVDLHALTLALTNDAIIEAFAAQTVTFAQALNAQDALDTLFAAQTIFDLTSRADLRDIAAHSADERIVAREQHADALNASLYAVDAFNAAQQRMRALNAQNETKNDETQTVTVQNETQNDATHVVTFSVFRIAANEYVIADMLTRRYFYSFSDMQAAKRARRVMRRNDRVTFDAVHRAHVVNVYNEYTFSVPSERMRRYMTSRARVDLDASQQTEHIAESRERKNVDRLAQQRDAQNVTLTAQQRLDAVLARLAALRS